MIKIYRSLLLVLFFSFFGLTQTKVKAHLKVDKTIEVVKWEVTDWLFHTQREVDHPFDKEAYAVVKGDDGEQRIPLFFNGNKEWVFRYSSSTTGIKNFVVESEINELDGRCGAFIVTENKKKNRHGGVVLKEEIPNRFFYEDGAPYFNLAFECDFLFALDYGAEEILKTKHLLRLIEENGFNQVVMNVYAFDVDTNWVQDKRLLKNPDHNFGGREDIFPFFGTNSNPDYSSLNIDFFKHLDRVIAEMHNREMVSHLMIYVWNKLVAWPEPGSDADNMYYDYVIKRYQAFPNIIWDVSKEATSKIALSKFENIAEHIRERAIRTRKLDAFNRLISVHAFEFCKQNQDVVDFMSTQDWKLSIYESMFKAYKAFPNKPVFNIEHGGYEESPYSVFPGGYSNAEVCLRRNYECLFAGTYTTYYWQGAAWSAIIFNPFEQPDDFYKPHFEYFKYLREFFDEVNYEKCVPVSSARSHLLVNKEDGILLQYLPKEVHSDDIKNLLQKDFFLENATSQWFNTITGDYTKEIPLEFPNMYGFWDWRPYRNEADAIWILRNLKPRDN